MFSFAKKLVDKFDGGSASGDSDDSYFKSTIKINNNGYGLRVLNIVPHSIAHEKGIESWFDYIVRINGHDLPMMNPTLSQYAYNINEDGSVNYGGAATREQVGEINFQLLYQELSTIATNPNGSHEVVFDVWNAKGGVIRQVVFPLTGPTETADANTAEVPGVHDLFKDTFAQLGLTVQSQHVTTANYVWRILTTHAGSPAFQAQLVPYSDYIIGCDSAFSDAPGHQGLLGAGGESLLSGVVQNYYNHHFSSTGEDCVPITLYVYNHDYDVLRPVTVNLSRAWGNGQQRGILGCDVGYGLLHRLPEVVGKFAESGLADDVLFESEGTYSYQNPSETQPSHISPSVPASTFIPQNTIPAPPRAGLAKKKKHPTAAQTAIPGLNDYMNEELAKSKELDTQGGSKTAVDASLPPPPPKSL